MSSIGCLLKFMLYLSLIVISPNLVFAAYFVDNSTSGCANGNKNYNPSTRNCGNGSDTVFTTWDNAHRGIPAGTRNSPTVVTVRSGKVYKNVVLNIRKRWTVWQKHASDKARPKIDNGFNASIKHMWRGVLTIYANHVVIDGIEIVKSGHYPKDKKGRIGSGVHVEGADYATIRNCSIHHMGGSAVRFMSDADYGVVKNNEMFECDYSKLERTRGPWGGTITVAIDCDGGKIINNRISRSGGEGINLSRSSDDWIISKNILWDHSRPSIYLAGSAHTRVHGNIVYHTNNARYGGTGGDNHGTMRGISVAAEDCTHFTGVNSSCKNTEEYDPSVGNLIYNNLVAGMRIGIGIMGSGDRSLGISDNKFYNNTVVNCRDHAVFVLDHRYLETGNEFRGNLFWHDKGRIAATPGGNLPSHKVQFGNNFWSKKPEGAFQDPADPTYPAYPTLNISDYFLKTNGWKHLAPGSLSAEDFGLLATARHALDEGQDLGYVFDVDHMGIPRPQGAGWDLGAMERVDESIADLSFTPAADGYLQNGNLVNNHHLKVQTSKSRVRESFIKFNVSGISENNLDNVVLRLSCVKDPGHGNIKVHLGSHNNWNERTLASNTPAKSTLVTQMHETYSDGMDYSFDVSSVVTGDGVYTFIISMDAGGNDVAFSSSEGSVKPELIVE